MKLITNLILSNFINKIRSLFNNTMNFNDGSVIRWDDRVSLRYIDKSFYATVWIDYDNSGNRSIMVQYITINNYYTKDNNDLLIISIRKNITLNKVIEYFKLKKEKVTIDFNRY